MSSTWNVVLTPTARTLLQNITDMRVRKAVAKPIEELRQNPEQRGKPLFEELAGYYASRAVGQRYRIIYQLEHHAVVVHVVALGIRKQGDKNDIYTLAQRLFRQGLLAPDDSKGEGREE
ncbi:MAG: type II toxin-antitoxin system RelE/ParE family toxin [Chloroflexota bacterium]|nr:type II toxin-antitoxin system RelE/ParE family toxin [Chloroflexota bacterium]